MLSAAPQLISCSGFWISRRSCAGAAERAESSLYSSQIFFLFPAFEQARIYIAQVSLN